MTVHADEMREFENPANGYREEIPSTFKLTVMVVLFGGLYWAIKGVWSHFFIWWGVTSLSLVLLGGAGWLISIIALAIYYSRAAHAALVHNYLRKGWNPVGFERE